MTAPLPKSFLSQNMLPASICLTILNVHVSLKCNLLQSWLPIRIFAILSMCTKIPLKYLQMVSTPHSHYFFSSFNQSLLHNSLIHMTHILDKRTNEVENAKKSLAYFYMGRDDLGAEHKFYVVTTLGKNSFLFSFILSGNCKDKVVLNSLFTWWRLVVKSFFSADHTQDSSMFEMRFETETDRHCTWDTGQPCYMINVCSPSQHLERYFIWIVLIVNTFHI